MGDISNFIKKLTEKCDIMGTLLPFHENYCAAVTKRYLGLKKEEDANMRIIVLFSFM